MTPVSDPRSLLGLSPTAEPLLDYLTRVAELTASKQLPTPDIKPYSDTVYNNYYPLGLSIMFACKGSSEFARTIDTQSDALVLDSVDIYNPEPEEIRASPETSTNTPVYAPYPVSRLAFSLLPGTVGNQPRPKELVLTPSSTGKDILSVLGEPDRKGGGAGPSSGSIGIWCEWSKDGIMIEFGGPDAKGPHAWERGKDAKWRVLTLFRPKIA